ncbi:MAG: hypothetical protein KKD39_05860, partial [Candidatus Altiarchaeota archaeon]|nr:hypothetical protein [Candidatus Altiarchaeota archaeon]
AAYSIATMYPSPEGYSECSFFDTKEQLEAYGYDCLFGEGYTTRLLFESTDRSCSGLIQLVDKSRSLLRCEDQLIPELPCGTHEEGWAEPYAGDEKIQQNHGKYFGCR